jgi:hypothetical protein
MRCRQNNTEHVFRQDWEAGQEYDLDLIREQVVPVLQQLKHEGKLGTVVARISVAEGMGYQACSIVKVLRLLG